MEVFQTSNVYNSEGQTITLGSSALPQLRRKANAKAIAALPDLLETLESIAHDFRCSDNAEHARDALTLAGYEF